MSKKLNIIEAMKMPIGTEFEVYNDGNKANCNAKIVKARDANSEKELVWHNRAYIPIHITNCSCDSTFIPIQQPVSFMEVVNSDKKCRVEHEFSKSKYYNTFVGIMYEFSTNLTSIELKRVIKEGKWYIEESEELEDERLS